MIIYIHGFGSSGKGKKAKLFRDYFKKRGIPFIAPSLSHIPDLAIDTLRDLVENFTDVKLIGSSLGGYYALYLSHKYNIKATLINPSVKPYLTLQLAIPYAVNYYDLSSFEWNKSYIEMLKKFDIHEIDEKKILLMLQKGDEVLDYNEALEKLPNANLIIEDGGDHSFIGIERYFERVESFLLEN
jgi:predicted esterase YcpF (UPF0227 family)